VVVVGAVGTWFGVVVLSLWSSVPVIKVAIGGWICGGDR
jgi:hypothetical protein